MKNKMTDLKDHLFAQLERLTDEALTPEQLEAEVKRSEAVVALADQITEGAKTQLAAAKIFAEYGQAVLPYLPQIGKPE